MRSERERLTTSEAAKFLSVSPSTLKRWADLGLVAFTRTTGGHRRFQRAILDDLASATGPSNNDCSRWAGALLESEEMLTLQSRLFALRSRLGSWWMVAERLIPAVFALHRRGEAGGATAIQVRNGLEQLRRTLGFALAYVPRSANSPTALVTCSQHEHSDVILILLELCLGEERWRTRWAGPASPQDISDELRRHRADVVIVSTHSLSDQNDLARRVRELPPIALEAGAELAFLGSDERPHAALGAPWFRDFLDIRAWLARINSRHHVAARDAAAARRRPSRDTT